MNLEAIAAAHDGELARRLRHLRGVNPTNPPAHVLVEMAEDEAEFFKGYARALKHFGHISEEEFGALVWEILEELEAVYLKHAPEKAAVDEADE